MLVYLETTQFSYSRRVPTSFSTCTKMMLNFLHLLTSNNSGTLALNASVNLFYSCKDRCIFLSVSQVLAASCRFSLNHT